MKCAHCDEESVTHLDGDDLCLKHANQWVHSEGREHAFFESEEELHHYLDHKYND